MSEFVFDDISTFLLMIQFYDKLFDDGLSPRRALRTAQRWLRDEVKQPGAGPMNPQQKAFVESNSRAEWNVPTECTARPGRSGR